MTKLGFALAALLSSSCTLLYGGFEASRGDMGPDGGCACKAPPADQCLDSATLRVYVSVGGCANVSCSYEHWDVLCENGCAAGACIGNDPCDGISCLEPPAPACTATDDLVVYATSGTCSMGFCSYMSTQTTCTTGCASGACTGEPCAGVLCDDPPSPSCSDASTLTSYVGGACANGSCSYTPVNTSCASGCKNGACVGNPCAGVTCVEPPAATCLDASTRRSYASAGMCTSGTCSYAPTDTSCANGCQGGLCSGDACSGVTCDQPPAPTCTTTTSLRTFAASGMCSNGNCSYAPTDTACAAPPNGAASCTSGACGFTCDPGYQPSGSTCVTDIVSGGLTWTALSSGTTDNLNAVWGSGPNDVYVAGNGIILHSANGGVTWAPTIGTANYMGMWGSSASDVYIVGPTLIHSSNGGVSWNPNANGTVGTTTLASIWGSGPNDVYVLDQLSLLHSVDGGATWTTLSFAAGVGSVDFGGLPLNFIEGTSVWGSASNDVYVSASDLLAQQSYVFHSSDQGATWSATTVSVAGAIWGTGANNLYLAGGGGAILHSTDGETWTAQSSGSQQPFFSMWGSSPSNIYAAGGVGNLIRSTDGSSWSPITTGSTNDLNCVWGSSASDVYVVGNNGTILHGH